MRPLVSATLVAAGLCAGARAQTCLSEQANLTWNGSQPAGLSDQISISPDGRFVAFMSRAPDLLPGPPPPTGQIYLRDLTTGLLELVSVNDAGQPAQGLCSDPCVSSGGRFVAFTTLAANLSAADVNGARDVYLRDRKLGGTTLVSRTPGGAAGNGDSERPALSADGGVICFQSAASDLIAGDVNGRPDSFYLERTSGRVTRVNLRFNGGPPHNGAFSPHVSADGRFVCFTSSDSLLVSGDTNGSPDVFRFELATGEMERVSLDSTGGQAAGASSRGTLSADGSRVAFVSNAALVATDLNQVGDVYVRDLVAGTTVRASVDSSGQGHPRSTLSGSLSPDGRWVAFATWAPLAPNDTNDTLNLYRRDLVLGRTSVVDVDQAGRATGALVVVAQQSISADGGRVVFAHTSRHLLATRDPNGWRDVFVQGCVPAGPSIYCVSQLDSLGCRPSLGFSGSPSAGAGSGFDVSLGPVLNNRAGLLFYGLGGATFEPFLDSFLCVRRPLRRTPVMDSGGNPPPGGDCSGRFVFDFNAWAAGGRDPGLVVGVAVSVQVWSRDGGAPSTTHLSDALAFTLGP